MAIFNRTYQLRAVKQAGGRNVTAALLEHAPAAHFLQHPSAPRAAKLARNGGKRHRGEDPRQLKLAFAMTDEELFEEFERTFPCK